jgi:hypothetical protein
MTPAGQPTSGSDPPPQPGPSSPNEPSGIFTANLKDGELANHRCRNAQELVAAAQVGSIRIRRDQELLFGFLRHAGLEL